MKVNPQLSPYRPAPPQYLPPKPAVKPAKAEAVDTSRLSAEEKLREAIEAKQSVVQETGVDGIQRAPLLGKLLDLRA